MDCSNKCDVIVSLIFSILLMGIALSPFGYIIQTELTYLWSLLSLLPSAAAIYLNINLGMLPCSWAVFFLSVFTSLPQEEKLALPRVKYARAIWFSSVALFLITTINVILLYAIDFDNFKTEMIDSMPNYLQDPSVKESWDTLQEKAECCGASGIDDWKEAGITNASICLHHERLGCMYAITTSVLITMFLNITAQASSLYISFHDAFMINGDGSTPLPRLLL